MKLDFIYEPPRPRLAVEHYSFKLLGPSYEADVYRITSIFKLTEADIWALDKANFLGQGQEKTLLSPCGLDSVPAGMETWQCVEYHDGKRVISKEPHRPIQRPFYVYDVEYRTNTGD